MDFLKGLKLIYFKNMLTTIGIILIVLWLVGLVASYTFSGWIHVLLVVGIIFVIMKFMKGKNKPPMQA